MNLEAGCTLPLRDWLELNRSRVFEDPDLRRFVSPFPPAELMTNVSGLQDERDFASHGADIYAALSAAAGKPLSAFESILDFGCGCGRLARLFKGHPGLVAGCDIDGRHVEWVNGHLPFMQARLSHVRPPIPYEKNEFDVVISISIFSHLNERSQDQFLAELRRVCRPGGRLFISVHGRRALDRALQEPAIRQMLDMDEARFRKAQQDFAADRLAFVLQFGHLTALPQSSTWRDSVRRMLQPARSRPFEYGITFLPEAYLRRHWGKWFRVVDYRHGGIHDFQDIVVLEPKK